MNLAIPLAMRIFAILILLNSVAAHAIESKLLSASAMSTCIYKYFTDNEGYAMGGSKIPGKAFPILTLDLQFSGVRDMQVFRSQPMKGDTAVVRLSGKTVVLMGEDGQYVNVGETQKEIQQPAEPICTNEPGSFFADLYGMKINPNLRVTLDSRKFECDAVAISVGAHDTDFTLEDGKFFFKANEQVTFSIPYLVEHVVLEDGKESLAVVFKKKLTDNYFGYYDREKCLTKAEVERLKNP